LGKRLTVKEKNQILAEEGKEIRNYGFLMRIYPTEEQAQLINKTFGCSRFAYNHYLAARKAYYKETGKTMSVGKYKKAQLVPMKGTEEYRFLKEVDKFALEAACENLDDAYKRFFSHLNKYPNFKSKRNAKKAYTTKMTNNNISIEGHSIKLPKLGKVEVAKIKTDRNKKIIEKIKNERVKILKATVTQKGKRYYVSLALEEVVELVPTLDIQEVDKGKVVGIDLGLKTFATIHNGKKSDYVEKANYIKKSEDKLKKLQRRLSKKEKHSKNFEKAKERVARLQEHIANQRKDFNHKLSSEIADENQVVILETLNIKEMVKNKRLAKAVQDAGWYQFIIFLKYKLKWQGKHMIQVDRWYASSKICSNCGEKNVTLTLGEREWICSHCGAIHERDENAAINIRNKGLETIGLQTA
jgi:putative transposase